MMRWQKMVEIGRLFFHPETPWIVKAILVVAGLYLISPVDLIPDWIVGLGIVDDIAVVSLLIGFAYRLLKKYDVDGSSQR